MNLAATHTQAERTAAARELWTGVLGDTVSMARRAEATDGEEVLEILHLRAGLARLKAGDFPAEGASAQRAADGFQALAGALLVAAVPRRRAILAPAVIAAARALDELITDQRETEAAGWRRHTGEGG